MSFGDFIEKFIHQPGVRFTFSQRKILSQIIPEICMRDGVTQPDFINESSIQFWVRSDRDSIQKGQKIFDLIRRKRYPRSNGRMETFPSYSKTLLNPSRQTSSGVSTLDSRKKLVNPYYYGDGVFDLKEYVISLIRFCPMDCAYCFLREIYDESRLKILPKFEQIGQEIREIRRQEEGIVYLNAGENADSMILDYEFNVCKNLWREIQPEADIFVEFRTKTNKVKNLFSISGHEGRIIPSFSINPEEDRQIFESNTATIQERIDAISDLQNAGFVIGLRFEPILYTRNFYENYKRFFDQIFRKVSLKNIHSISLGCMRLTKGLAGLLRKSYPDILAEEWVYCSDKKFRYYQEIRIEMYASILELLKKYFLATGRIVLSTEPVNIWEKSGVSLKTMPEICALSSHHNIPAFF